MEHRAEQRYMAICTKVNRKDIPSVLPPLIPEVIKWLKENNIPVNGLPFFRYQSVNNQNEFEVAVGLLVHGQVMGNGHIIEGIFPAGNYASLTYTGDYKNMKDAHMALESWTRQNELEEKQQKSEQGIEWGGRAEFYLNDCEEEPYPEKWQTEIVFLLED